MNNHSNIRNSSANRRHGDDLRRPIQRVRSANAKPASSSLYHSEAAKAARAKALASLPDLAELIGLAFQHAQAGNFRPGSVPDSVMHPLSLHGLLGSETARLVVDHINRRAFSTMSRSHRLGLFKAMIREVAGDLS